MHMCLLLMILPSSLMSMELRKVMVEAEEPTMKALARTILDIALITTSMVIQLNFAIKSMDIHKLINLYHMPTLTIPMLMNHINIIHHQK